jgi:hypothetical protein
MSRDQARYLLVVALLAVGAAAALALAFAAQPAAGARVDAAYRFVTDIDNWRRTEREQTITSPYNLSVAADLNAIQLKLGNWVGADVPQTSVEVFILLEPEQFVQRLYRRADGKMLWLSVIGSRRSKSFHSPQICYDTDGWKTDAGSAAVPLVQGEVHALRLLASKPYGDGVATHAILYFYLWPSYARDARDGMVLVKLTAPLQGSVEETLALEQEFFRQLFVSAQP